MLRTLDIILIVIMTAVAAVTYTIKHRAELKLEEVHKIEAEIKLEKDTIDLLRADWALLTQPSRLQKLITVYQEQLQLQPTDPTQLVKPVELPMKKDEVPAKDPTIQADAKDKIKTKGKTKANSKTDNILTGSVKR
jgi:hypothetical protein